MDIFCLFERKTEISKIFGHLLRWFV